MKKQVRSTTSDIVKSVKDAYGQFVDGLRRSFSTDEDSGLSEGARFAAYALGALDESVDTRQFLLSDITDGSDDKGIDFCHIDTGEDRCKAYIGQIYFSPKWPWGNHTAPEKKASYIMPGISALLDNERKFGNPRIQAKARELQNALTSKSISEIHLLYIHNVQESDNVKKSLDLCVQATNDIVENRYGGCALIQATELGLKTINNRNRSDDGTILVNDVISLPEEVGFIAHQNGIKWKALTVSVPCKWVAGLCETYENNLFSANFRGYLGARAMKGNINLGIQTTAREEPENFWIFNNGITAITKKIQKNGDKPPTVKGLSIVNGAQTAGALRQVYEKPVSGSPSVLLRIIECGGKRLINDIVSFNNTQNVIRPEDKWSKDDTQKELGKQFQAMGLDYVYRRSGNRTFTPFKISTMGKILCAFHVDFQKAWNSNSIFNNSTVFNRVFSAPISAGHCVLIYALSQAIDNTRSRLRNKVKVGNAPSYQEEQGEILQYSAAKYFLMHIVSGMVEEIFGKKIPNKFLLVPHEVKDGQWVHLVEAWEKLIGIILPSISDAIKDRGKSEKMVNPAYDIPRSVDHTNKVAEKVLLRFRERMGENPGNTQDIAKLVNLSSSGVGPLFD